MARMVNCIKLNIEAEGLDFPPYPGPLGKQLYEQVSRQAWKDWLDHQKRLVNENRLRPLASVAMFVQASLRVPIATSSLLAFPTVA